MSIPATGVAAPLGTSGSGSPVRESRELAQVMAQLGGKYYENASRGTVFSGMSVTGRTPQITITVTVPITLYNPVGSGKRFEILKVCVQNAPTGTLGCGAIYHCGYTLNGPLATQAGTVPTGTAIVASCLDVGSATSSAASCLSAATLSAAPVALYPGWQMGQEVGGTTANAMFPNFEDVDGMIVLEPGGGWALCGTSTTGSSPLVLCGVVWREVVLTA